MGDDAADMAGKNGQTECQAYLWVAIKKSNDKQETLVRSASLLLSPWIALLAQPTTHVVRALSCPLSLESPFFSRPTSPTTYHLSFFCHLSLLPVNHHHTADILPHEPALHAAVRGRSSPLPPPHSTRCYRFQRKNQKVAETSKSREKD